MHDHLIFHHFHYISLQSLLINTEINVVIIDSPQFISLAMIQRWMIIFMFESVNFSVKFMISL